MKNLCWLWELHLGPAPVKSYKREEHYHRGEFKIDFWTDLEELTTEEEAFEEAVIKLCKYED